MLPNLEKSLSRRKLMFRWGSVISESSTFLLVDPMVRRVVRRLALGMVHFKPAFFWTTQCTLGPEIHVYIEVKSLTLYLYVTQGLAECSWKLLLYQDTSNHITDTGVTENHLNTFYPCPKHRWNISSTRLSLSWLPHMLMTDLMPSNAERKLGVKTDSNLNHFG